VAHVGRGLWAHPSNPVRSVRKLGSGATSENHEGITADKSNTESNTPTTLLDSQLDSGSRQAIATNGKFSESNNLTDLTGPERGNGQSSWPPALGPAGDDVFDIDPTWRRRTLTTVPSSCGGRQ